MSYSAGENGQKRSWKDHLGNWRAYAAAAGATLASASSAEANIIYSVAQPPIEAKLAHLPPTATTSAVTGFTIHGAQVDLRVFETPGFLSGRYRLDFAHVGGSNLRFFGNGGGVGLMKFAPGAPIAGPLGGFLAYGALGYFGFRGTFSPGHTGFAG